MTDYIQKKIMLWAQDQLTPAAPPNLFNQKNNMLMNLPPSFNASGTAATFCVTAASTDH
jgi:hypothetical protein